MEFSSSEQVSRTFQSRMEFPGLQIRLTNLPNQRALLGMTKQLIGTPTAKALRIFLLLLASIVNLIISIGQRLMAIVGTKEQINIYNPKQPGQTVKALARIYRKRKQKSQHLLPVTYQDCLRNFQKELKQHSSL
nr:MAG: putative transmembrane protein [Polycipiviridae sp.]